MAPYKAVNSDLCALREFSKFMGYPGRDYWQGARRVFDRNKGTKTFILREKRAKSFFSEIKRETRSVF